MELFDLLSEITALGSPSGRESGAAEFIKKQLSGIPSVTDRFGNTMVTVKEGNGKHIVLDAHIDEIGFVVTGIQEGGFVRIAPVGGIDARLLPGAKLVFYGKDKAVGVVCTTPPHLQSDEEEKSKKTDELWVDIGSAEGVEIGNFGRFLSCAARLGGDLVSANGLDDKAGAAALLLCADMLGTVNNDTKVTLLFSTQEELGERGAKAAGFTLQPDEFIAVDVSFALSPGVPKHKCGLLGKGPMIGVAPTLNEAITRKLIETAEKWDIPYQKEIMSGSTGTNADSLGITASGVPTGLVSIPLRFMHTPNEVIDLNDVLNTATLLCRYIESVGGTAK